MASADLQWLIVRNNSSFLLKRNKQNFTLEPNNLRGRNSLRYNGLVQKRTVGVEAAKDGKGVVLVTKSAQGFRNPAKNVKRIELKRDARRTYSAIRKITKAGGYRKDLGNAAVRRAAAIIKSQKPVVPRRTGRGRKE